jgi:hypothetical protein
MELYIAAMESTPYLYPFIDDNSIKYNLSSFFALKPDVFKIILQKCQKILIDSGAFSFQRGKKVDYDAFTDKYIQFIRENAFNSKIAGFFEMDIDALVGYEKVLEYRKKLINVGGDKIIPVWHKGRGLEDFYKMCDEKKGQKISVSAISNRDIGEYQYNLFINEAHRRGCLIHILGLTRYNLIKNLNLGLHDSVDSSTWLHNGYYGDIYVPNNNLTIYHLRDLTIRKRKVDLYVKSDFLSTSYLADKYESWDNSISNDRIIY